MITVADHLHERSAILNERSEDRRIAVIERRHAVESMGERPIAKADCEHAFAIARRGVACGTNDAVFEKDTRGIEIGHGFAERTTFVVTGDGKIAATVGGLAPAENVAKTLEFVERLSGH